MSRIGKIPVNVPKEVKTTIDAHNVHMEGPKGKLDLVIPHGIKVELKEDQLIVSRHSQDKQVRTNHGTIRACLSNMVKGVTEGHKKDLEIQGIGFRAQMKGESISFSLGLSHPVEFAVPKDIKVSVNGQTNITVEGPDNIRVGAVAAKIKDIKPVEPYKGKGIRYAGEFVRRKQGKSVGK